MMSIYGNPHSEYVLIQMADEQDLRFIDREVAEIQKLVSLDFSLMAISVDNWNRDLSPWKAPGVFGNEDFGEGAGETLKSLLSSCTDDSKTYIIGGYSLAGLFALWCAFQTDRFSGVAAASPSVWFPEFTDYMKKNTIHSKSVYLSLGDKEEKTRNPVMATVGKKIREAHDTLLEQGVETILEWNSGNHFKDADIRTARAFAWTLTHYLK